MALLRLIMAEKNLRCSPGFSLIEVLIAVFILTISLLGFDLVLLSAAQHSRDLVLQAQAVQYAEGMLDRISANPRLQGRSLEYGEVPSVHLDCDSGPCEPSQMATFEFANWKCLLAGYRHSLCHRSLAESRTLSICADWALSDGCYALPEGDGRIDVQGRNYKITVRWRHANADKSDNSFQEVFVITRI